jgi:ferredoxin
VAYQIIETCIGCTACTKRCPTNAISGKRSELHVIDPKLCIDCGACGVVCPPEAILDETGDVCRTFPRKEWPKAVVIEDNCIGSGCELCIQICPFDALSLEHTDHVTDFFGVAVVNEKRCTGCRLCEQACGWDAIHIDQPREMQKKKVWEEAEGPKEPVTA